MPDVPGKLEDLLLHAWVDYSESRPSAPEFLRVLEELMAGAIHHGECAVATLM